MTTQPTTWKVARPDVPDGELHWSELVKMLDSPLACLEAARTPREDTAATEFGSLAHLLVLEPERLESVLLVEPKFGNLRTKAGKANRAAWYAEVCPDAPPVEKTDHVARAKRFLPPGVMIVSEADKERALALRQAVWDHKPAAELLEAAIEFELDLKWERMGVQCGGRIDALVADCAVDLKTTRFSSLRDLKRDLTKRQVYGQLAWYHDGAIRVGRLPRFETRFPRVIAVQSEPPHDVAVLAMTPESFAAGVALGDELLTQWIGCVETGWWPGMADQVVRWDLPDWAPGMNVANDNGEPW